MAKYRHSAGGTPVKIKVSGTGAFGDNPDHGEEFRRQQ